MVYVDWRRLWKSKTLIEKILPSHAKRKERSIFGVGDGHVDLTTEMRDAGLALVEALKTRSRRARKAITTLSHASNAPPRNVPVLSLYHTPAPSHPSTIS